MLVERQVGDRGFQLAILFAQLLKLAQLVRGKPSVFPLPTVKRLLGHALFPANIAGLLPRLDLPQGQDDLLFGMPFPRHSSSPRFRSEDHSRRRSQLFRGLIFGFWVKRQVCQQQFVSVEGVTPFRCAKTVSELDLFERLGLLFERKQIPRFVVNIRISRKTMEPLEPLRSLGRRGSGVQIAPPRPTSSLIRNALFNTLSIAFRYGMNDAIP